MNQTPHTRVKTPLATRGLPVLSLILTMVASQACGLPNDKCPSDMITLFEKENPQAEIVTCEKLVASKTGRPDGVYESIQYGLSFRQPPNESIRYKNWTYVAKDNGPFELKSRGEILTIDKLPCPDEMIILFGGGADENDKILSCSGARVGDEARFYLTYRNSENGKTEQETWIYKLQGGGELKLEKREKTPPVGAGES